MPCQTDAERARVRERWADRHFRRPRRPPKAPTPHLAPRGAKTPGSARPRAQATNRLLAARQRFRWVYLPTRPFDSTPTHLRSAPRHLLLGDVLHVRGDVPAMSIGVLELPGTIPIELIFDLAQPFRSSLDRALECSICVLDVDVDRHGRPSDRFGTLDVHPRVLVGKHNHGLANLKLGVTDLAVGSIQAHALAGAQHSLVELDRLVRTIDDQVGHYLRVVVRYWLDHRAASLDGLRGDLPEAGDGNRTRPKSLEGFCATTTLRPQEHRHRTVTRDH